MNIRPSLQGACALLLASAISGAGARAETIGVGSRVATTVDTVVRTGASSAAAQLGTAGPGMLGSAVDGPVAAADGTWWKIDFEGPIDGWTTADRLALPYFPPTEGSGGWRRLVTPNSVPSSATRAAIRAQAGLDWNRLRDAQTYSASFTSSSALLVIRNGWIGGEWGTNTARGVASVSKSLTGMVAAKLFDLAGSGSVPATLRPSEPAYRLLPASWGDADPRRRLISIENLMTMASGVEPDDNPSQADYLSVVLSRRVVAPPDTVWAYASLPVDLLGIALQTTVGSSVRDLFNTHIAGPLGIPALSWSSFSGYSHAASGATIRPRDLARVGYLLMQRGLWDRGPGQQRVVSEQSLALLRRGPPCIQTARFTATPGSPFVVDQDSPDFYGHLWWTNLHGRGLGSVVPSDAVYARGLRENLLVVVPSLDLLVVRLGDGPTTVPGFRRELMRRIMGAIVGPAETVTAQAVRSLSLIDADADQPLPLCDPLPDGAVVNLATLPTRSLNIRANTDPSIVGSVRFALDGNANYRTETGPPYALAGDSGGNFNNWTPSTGQHTVIATPYSGAGATGTAGLPLTIGFVVVDQPLARAQRITAAAR